MFRSRTTRRASLLPFAILAILIAAGPVSGATGIVSYGPRTEKVIALTFDDGYYPAAIRSMLSTLQREGVRATFFPISAVVRGNPSLWRSVVAAGHVIGNHTVDHKDLATLGYDAVYRQITVSRTAITRSTGVAQIPFLRPPYGSWDSTVVQAATAAGYRRIVLWDVDTQDWRRPPVRAIVDRAVRGRAGSIVLMHTLPGTAEALPSIIRDYKARGFRFVTIPELFS